MFLSQFGLRCCAFLFSHWFPFFSKHFSMRQGNLRTRVGCPKRQKVFNMRFKHHVVAWGFLQLEQNFFLTCLEGKTGKNRTRRDWLGVSRLAFAMKPAGAKRPVNLYVFCFSFSSLSFKTKSLSHNRVRLCMQALVFRRRQATVPFLNLANSITAVIINGEQVCEEKLHTHVLYQAPMCLRTCICVCVCVCVCVCMCASECVHVEERDEKELGLVDAVKRNATWTREKPIA